MIKLRKDQVAYIQIGKHILKRIALGELDEGNKIGTIRSLATDYKVTTKTIQKAVGYLEDREIISRVQSSGLYIQINNEMATKMLYADAVELTEKYIEDLRDINNIDNIESLIQGGLKDDKNN